MNFQLGLTLKKGFAELKGKEPAAFSYHTAKVAYNKLSSIALSYLSVLFQSKVLASFGSGCVPWFKKCSPRKMQEQLASARL